MSGLLALVTGGGSGIGQSVCRVLASNSKTSIICVDIDGEKAQKTIQGLESISSSSSMGIEVDVSSSSSVTSLFKTIIDTYKRPPDILVNSAGIIRDGYLLRMKEADFDSVINVNLKGTYLMTQAAAYAMKKANYKKGCIVNVSSVVGKIGNIGQANYSASKAGVIGFTKTAAKELGKFGIRVNCVCPGFIKTPMTDQLPEQVKQMVLFQIPLGDFGDPEDIAETIAFLTSDKAKYINGAVIDVNGGLF